MRFRGRTVIDIPPNVEVELFLLQFLERDDSGILVEVLSSSIDLSNLLNVFCSQRVLVLAFFELSIRIDEQHIVRLFLQPYDAGQSPNTAAPAFAPCGHG